jgi:hypothetical protein
LCENHFSNANKALDSKMFLLLKLTVFLRIHVCTRMWEVTHDTWMRHLGICRHFTEFPPS